MISSRGVNELTDLAGSDPARVFFRRIILAMSCPFPCGTSWGSHHPGLEILNRNVGGGFLGVCGRGSGAPRGGSTISLRLAPARCTTTTNFIWQSISTTTRVGRRYSHNRSSRVLLVCWSPNYSEARNRLPYWTYTCLFLNPKPGVVSG